MAGTNATGEFLCQPQEAELYSRLMHNVDPIYQANDYEMYPELSIPFILCCQRPKGGIFKGTEFQPNSAPCTVYSKTPTNLNESRIGLVLSTFENYTPNSPLVQLFSE